MKKLAVLLFSLMLCVGCAKKVPIHPGSISNLDSYSYDVLLAEQDVLNAAKADFLAGNLPNSSKDALNAAIKQYNVTQDLWQGYHANGANADALSQGLSALVTSVGDIQKLRGKSATGPVPSSGLAWPGRIQFVYGGAM